MVCRLCGEEVVTDWDDPHIEFITPSGDSTDLEEFHAQCCPYCVRETTDAS